MKINRRQFIIAAAGLAAGCDTVNEQNPASSGRPGRVVNAGTAANYAADGVYGRFRDVGFFVVRDGYKLFALSSYCTHRHCKLNLEKNHSFVCPCHGSTFDPGGRVTTGPARRDLPVLTTSVNERGELVVTVPNS